MTREQFLLMTAAIQSVYGTGMVDTQLTVWLEELNVHDAAQRARIAELEQWSREREQQHMTVIHELETENARLEQELRGWRHAHVAGCPVLADDVSDQVLADYQWCTCRPLLERIAELEQALSQ